MSCGSTVTSCGPGNGGSIEGPFSLAVLTAELAGLTAKTSAFGKNSGQFRARFASWGASRLNFSKAAPFKYRSAGGTGGLRVFADFGGAGNGLRFRASSAFALASASFWFRKRVVSFARWRACSNRSSRLGVAVVVSPWATAWVIIPNASVPTRLQSGAVSLFMVVFFRVVGSLAASCRDKN